MKLVAIVGPTASGKSALGLDLAESWGGEIIACDSTAVYRGIDIGTDKIPAAEQRGIAHHLVDVVPPTDVYSAARYADDAARAARAIVARGRVPLLVGGTGFYVRALLRGMFPGPARDDELRTRLNIVAERRGVESLHRWLERVDPESGRRIQPRDRKRLIRALEVYLATGRPLTAHFEQTTSVLPDAEVLMIGVRVSREQLLARVIRRVEAQFARGVVDEVRRLLDAGVPRSAHAFSGLVYRQVLEMLDGVRDEPATRALIVRENMRYAKRQLTWFRKEPDVHWLDTTDAAEATRRAHALVHAFLIHKP